MSIVLYISYYTLTNHPLCLYMEVTKHCTKLCRNGKGCARQRCTFAHSYREQLDGILRYNSSVSEWNLQHPNQQLNLKAYESLIPRVREEAKFIMLQELAMSKSIQEKINAYVTFNGLAEVYGFFPESIPQEILQAKNLEVMLASTIRFLSEPYGLAHKYKAIRRFLDESHRLTGQYTMVPYTVEQLDMCKQALVNINAELFFAVERVVRENVFKRDDRVDSLMAKAIKDIRKASVEIEKRQLYNNYIHAHNRYVGFNHLPHLPQTIEELELNRQCLSGFSQELFEIARNLVSGDFVLDFVKGKHGPIGSKSESSQSNRSSSVIIGGPGPGPGYAGLGSTEPLVPPWQRNKV